MIEYSLSRKTEDFLRFRSIFGSWRGGVLFCSVPVFEVTALLKKGSPIYRKTAIYRAFHAFSEYVFSMRASLKCPAALEAVSLKRNTSTAFWFYSSSLRLRTPDAFTAPNPNAMNNTAPTHRSQFVTELFPVWGRLTSALEESVPVPVFGSTV